MDRRNFHQRFVNSLGQRDWQLGALIVVPVAAFLLAETVSALVPARSLPDRCTREVRAYVTERMIGALVFDIGRPEITDRSDGALIVEIDIEANGIPLRTAYRCSQDGSSQVTVRRMWTRRV
jgi:hypothetical protein